MRARGEESHPHWGSQEVTSDLKLGMKVRVKQTKQIGRAYLVEEIKGGREEGP